MSENKLNVLVPRDYDGTPIEIILREGKAAEQLPNHEPLPVSIDGTIDTPLRWLEKKVELIDQKKAYISVSRDEMSISLVDKENDYYSNSISGQLKPSKEMKDFGINTDKHWEPAKLSQFCKMKRSFFRDKAANMALVSTLKNFKAKVAQDIERSNLPKSFKLFIPLFKGFEPEEIEVEIYADVDGRDVSLSLVSAGANETMEENKNGIINELLNKISTIAPDIAIIEV